MSKVFGLNVRDSDKDFIRFVGYFKTKEKAMEKVKEIYKKRGVPVDYEIYDEWSDEE